MATMGNLAFQLEHASANALTSTDFRVIYPTKVGAALAVAYITGIADLSAARGSEDAAGGCLVISVHSASTVSSHLFVNVGASSTISDVSWEELAL